MPQGLQIWNGSGVIVLDTNDRLGRYIGRYFANHGSLTDVSNVPVPGMADNGQWIAVSVNFPMADIRVSNGYFSVTNTVGDLVIDVFRM